MWTFEVKQLKLRVKIQRGLTEMDKHMWKSTKPNGGKQNLVSKQIPNWSILTRQDFYRESKSI